MSPLTVWGLKTCDTCRKARNYLEAEGIASEWRDVRADGLDRETIAMVLAHIGEGGAINRRSTTWRGLPGDERNRSAADLLVEHPTLLKRPVFIAGDAVYVGFDAEVRTWLKSL